MARATEMVQQIENRVLIDTALDDDDIESRPLWKPLHLQPVFAGAPAHVDGTSEDLFRRYQRQEHQRWKRRLWSPLALRFPLLDPDRLLTRGLPVVRPLFG